MHFFPVHKLQEDKQKVHQSNIGLYKPGGGAGGGAAADAAAHTRAHVTRTLVTILACLIIAGKRLLLLHCIHYYHTYQTCNIGT